MFLDGFTTSSVNSHLQKLIEANRKPSRIGLAASEDVTGARPRLQPESGFQEAQRRLTNLLYSGTRQIFTSRADGKTVTCELVKSLVHRAGRKRNCTATNDKTGALANCNGQPTHPLDRKSPGQHHELIRTRSTGSGKRERRSRSSSFKSRSISTCKHLAPWASILLVLANLLICARSAPLVFQSPESISLARIQPIWLHEGLIALEPENDVEVADGERLRASWNPAAASDERTDFVPDLVADRESLWVQRRRLNRDRASEPAPWMREQPMRRGSSPAAPIIDPEDEKKEVVETKSSPQTSFSSRKSRQLPNRAYEDLIKYLVEEVLDNKQLLSRLYDELGERIRANQMGTSADLTNSELGQPVGLQSVGLSPAVDSTGDEDVSMVLANDDVATGDGPSSVVAAAPYAKLELANDRLPEGQMDSILSSGELRSAGQEPAEFNSQPDEPFHVLEDIDRVDSGQQDAHGAQPEVDQFGQASSSDSFLGKDSEMIMKRAAGLRWLSGLGWPDSGPIERTVLPLVPPPLVAPPISKSANLSAQLKYLAGRGEQYRGEYRQLAHYFGTPTGLMSLGGRCKVVYSTSQ